MPLRILSFDYDGCLAKKFQDVLEWNESLLSSIKEKNSLYTKTVVLVGSNRQAFETDLAGIERLQNGSCFLEIPKVSDYLGAEFDPLLLPDIFNEVEDGTTFKQGVAKHTEGCPSYKYLPYVFDESKMMLIYAQIHHIANKNLGEDIEYNFYDDVDEILKILENFFKSHPELIPSNVTINLHKYDDTRTPTHRCTLKGTGQPDIFYKENVKIMAERGIQEAGDYYKWYRGIHDVI